MSKFIRSLSFGEWISLVGFIFGICLCLLFIARIPAHIIGEAECLEKGYKNYQIDYKFNLYCVNTFNTFTDVKPIKELK